MKKADFFDALRRGLAGLPEADAQNVLDYYGELIDDRVDEGMDEEAAVAALGSVDELAAAMADGSLEEAFGSGTAAVVSPIGALIYKDKEYVVNGGKIGKLTQHLYDTLTGIQWGKTEDKFGWTVKL